MTSVEELGSAPAPPSFETVYNAERGTLYRALVLATGNRDIAVEAVDRAFARWQSRRASQQGNAAQQIFTAAYKWAARKVDKPSRMIQGFRLAGADTPDSDEELLSHFDDLSLTDRALLVAKHFLGWDADTSAATVGIPPGEAVPRSSAAESRLARSAGVPVPDAASRLRSALAQRAEGLVEPLQRSEAVKTQALWRKVGTRTAAVVGGIALVGGLAFGVQQLATGGEDDPTAASGDPNNPAGTTGSESNGAGVFEASTLLWEPVQVPIRQGEVNSVAFGPSGFVAVGQDWSGAAGGSLSLFSEDGIVWEVGPSLTPERNGWVNQLVYVGDRYIAVGSGFDEVAGTESAFVAMSSDGLDWSSIRLPFENQIQLGGEVIDLYSYVQMVAATEDQILVLAGQHAEFDPMPMIEEALGEDIRTESWGFSDRGLEMYTNNGELERRITWDEIGIDEEIVQFITSGRPLLLRSSDFETWDEVEITGFGANNWFTGIAALDDRLAAVVYGDFGPSLYVSGDGGSWEVVDDLADASIINNLATVGDRVIAVGSNLAGESAAWATTDLETWESVDLPPIAGQLQRIQVSPTGIAILAEETPGANGTVVIEVDDLTVVASQTGGFTLMDADGEEVTRIPSTSVRWNDEGLVELRDPDSDELLVSFDQRELDQAWEQFWRQFEQQNQFPSFTLLLSEDGISWTSHPLSDVVGDGFYPNGFAVGEDSVVMTGWSEGGGGIAVDVLGGGGPNVTIWVGTP